MPPSGSRGSFGNYWIEVGMRNSERGMKGKEMKSESENGNGRSVKSGSALRAPNSDLKARTFDFSLRVMRLAESLPNTKSGRTVANQIIRSGTSVGANYRAAKRAKSTKDFISKMGTVEEECDETIYWIELAIAAGCVDKAKVDSLLAEANELLAITVASIITAKGRAK